MHGEKRETPSWECVETKFNLLLTLHQTKEV